MLSVILRNNHPLGGGCGKSKLLIDLGSNVVSEVYFSLPVVLMFCFCLPDCSCADLRPRFQWFHALLAPSFLNWWEDGSAMMLLSFVWGAWPVYPIITNPWDHTNDWGGSSHWWSGCRSHHISPPVSHLQTNVQPSGPLTYTPMLHLRYVLSSFLFACSLLSIFWFLMCGFQGLMLQCCIWGLFFISLCL